MRAEKILDLFSATSGTVYVAGAGGKKSLLNYLAALHNGRIAMTATVHTAPFSRRLDAEIVVAEEALLPAAVRDAAKRRTRIAYALPSAKPGRVAGVPPALVERLHRELGFDLSLVKADGARMRWFKAPGEEEPQLPAECDTVLFVVSAKVIGQPLEERVAHRIERIEALTGLQRGEIVRPLHVARVLAHPAGALKGVGSAKLIPVLNMVDDSERRALAEAVAEHALALSSRFDRVILTCLTNPDPVVAVVSASSSHDPD